ncbi:MAG TPA: MauE/DoxX family redox-associated membrane protein [Actinomycetota bacterium]|nr:MauE/DoxX family redox-associated membrane protein [Actinomycetota bacterium]
MPDVTIRIASAMLGAVFLWSGAAKALRWEGWKYALGGYRLPRWAEAATAPAVIVIEWGIALLLLAGATRVGAALALAVLSAFSLAVLRARSVQGDRLPCGCFGGRRDRDYRAMLVRNALLEGLAALLLVGGRDVSIIDGMRMPRSSELVPAAFVALAVVVIVWMVFHAFVSLRRRQS